VARNGDFRLTAVIEQETIHYTLTDCGKHTAQTFVQRFPAEQRNVLQKALQSNFHPRARLQQLQEVGRILALELFPPALLDCLDQEEIRTLELDVPLTLYWVPWEMTIVGSEFLSQRYPITRTISEAMSNTRYSMVQFPIRLLIVANPENNLPWASHEVNQIISTLREVHTHIHIEVLAGAQATRYNILQRLRECDIFHFSGHSRVDIHGDAALYCAAGEKLALKELSKIKHQIKLIFLNSCESGAVIGFSDIVNHSFVRALFDQGVTAMVLTIREIEDASGAYFAGGLYRTLAEGKTIGHAVHDAQKTIRRHDAASTIWANYVLFGSPHFHLRRSRHEEHSPGFAMIQAGCRALEVNNTKRARQYFTAAKKSGFDADALKTYTVLINYYEKKFSEAYSALLHILQEQPKNPFVLLWLGNTCYKLGKHNAAYEYWKEALHGKPDTRTFAEVLYALFLHTVLSRSELKQYADELVSRAHHEWFETHDEEAMLAESIGNIILNKLSRAKNQLLELVSIAPGNLRAYRMLARLSYRTDDFVSALQYYQRLLRFVPDDEELLYELAGIYYSLGYIEESIAGLEKIISRHIVPPEYFYNLANCYMRIRDQKPESIKKAFMYYHKAIHRNSAFAPAYFNLAVLYQQRNQKGDIDRAEEYYKKAIALKYQLPVAYFNLGHIYVQKEYYRYAYEAFQKAFIIDPDFKDANINYSHALDMFRMGMGAAEHSQLGQNLLIAVLLLSVAIAVIVIFVMVFF